MYMNFKSLDLITAFQFVPIHSLQSPDFNKVTRKSISLARTNNILASQKMLL